MIDLIEELNTPVIVVSRNYLGSINHTLMTVEILKKRKIKILGLIINGEPNVSSENYISNYTGLPILLRVKQEETIDQQTILKYAKKIKRTILKKNENEN
jgi:dethiobiotin synthetase